MALTLNNFWGDTGPGVVELSATSGTVLASGTGGRTDGGYYYVNTGTSGYFEISPFESVADGGTGYVYGFAMDGKYWPVTEEEICAFMEGTTVVLSLVQQTDGTVDVKDAGGSVVRTITTGWPDGIGGGWDYIEVYFEHSNSGTVEVFLNGVSQGSDATVDTSAGGTFDTIRHTQTSVISHVNLFDDMYFLSGAASSSDAYGDAEVIAYDTDAITATDVGASLDIGAWDDVTIWHTPLVAPVQAEYTGAAAGSTTLDHSTRGGPSGDSKIDGDSNLKGIKGIWSMERSGGGAAAHYGLLGNSVDGTTRSADFDPPTTQAVYFFVSEAASVVPLSTEYARIGFETTGGQDFECYYQHAKVLHVPTSTGPQTITQSSFFDQTSTFYDGTLELFATQSAVLNAAPSFFNGAMATECVWWYSIILRRDYSSRRCQRDAECSVKCVTCFL
jgi:hypothetical protein